MKIGSPLATPFLSNLSSATKADRSETKVRIEGQDNDILDVTRSSQSEGASLSASKAKSSAEVADEATKAIYDIRQEQLALAKQANDINDEETRATYQAEIDNLQTEVNRISAEEDGAGNNVLDELSLEVSEDTQLVLSDRSSLASDPGIDVSTISGASSAVATLTDAVDSAQSARTATSATKDKAEAKLEEIVAREAEARLGDSSKIQDEQEAEKVAKDIATQVVNKAQEDAVVSNLVSGQVESLLSG